MIRDLVKLRELTSDTTLLVLQYDLHFDGNEILFKYWIYRGFGETKIEEIRNLNACSYKTNRAYFYKELLLIRRYIKSNVAVLNQSPIGQEGK
jgi:hypothetical protein